MTLEGFAEAKKLAIEFLWTFGLRTSDVRGAPRVEIPYLNGLGEVAAIRYRHSMDGDLRFTWRRGDHAMLYGLQRVLRAYEHGYAVIVEGESDALTAWKYDLPVFGAPGKGTLRAEWLEPFLVKGLQMYLWCEPDALDVVQRLAPKVPDLRILTPPVGIKDLSDAYLAGLDVKALLEQLRTESHPAIDIAAAADARDRARKAEEALQDSAGLLDDRRLMQRIAVAIRKHGWAGDSRPPRLVYLSVTSRCLSRPVNLGVEGPSAVGKNFMVNTTMDLFPTSAVYVLTAASERAFVYNEESFAHRMVVIDESAALHTDGIGASLMRGLAWQQRLVYETVEKTPAGMRSRRIEKDGPTGLITTTTKGLDPELATRMLSTWVPDDPKQTRAVVRDIGRRAQDGDPELDLAPFIAAQTWLDIYGNRKIVIPYARQLAELVAVGAIRMRRDFSQLLSLVRTSAFLHQRQRPADGRGWVTATVADYQVVYDLIAESMRSASGGLTKRQQEAVDAVRDLQGRDPDKEVSARQVAKRLGVEAWTASRHLREAVKRGYLINLETERMKPARYLATTDPPTPGSAIPTPEALAARMDGRDPEPPGTEPEPRFDGSAEDGVRDLSQNDRRTVDGDENPINTRASGPSPSTVREPSTTVGGVDEPPGHGDVPAGGRRAPSTPVDSLAKIDEGVTKDPIYKGSSDRRQSTPQNTGDDTRTPPLKPESPQIIAHTFVTSAALPARTRRSSTPRTV